MNLGDLAFTAEDFRTFTNPHQTGGGTLELESLPLWLSQAVAVQANRILAEKLAKAPQMFMAKGRQQGGEMSALEDKLKEIESYLDWSTYKNVLAALCKCREQRNARTNPRMIHEDPGSDDAELLAILKEDKC